MELKNPLLDSGGVKARLCRKAITTQKDQTTSYIYADISFPVMAFNETFGDRIINLFNSPDGDSHFFPSTSCHLNQKREACPLFLQGNLIYNAVMYVMKASTLCTCLESF